MRRVQHSEEISFLTNTTNICEPFLSVDQENIKSNDKEINDNDENMSRHGQLSQEELNDLIQDHSLSKRDSEILASRLREKNCLQPEVKIKFYPTREVELLPYFSQDKDLVYCNHIE